MNFPRQKIDAPTLAHILKYYGRFAKGAKSESERQRLEIDAYQRRRARQAEARRLGWGDNFNLGKANARQVSHFAGLGLIGRQPLGRLGGDLPAAEVAPPDPLHPLAAPQTGRTQTEPSIGRSGITLPADPGGTLTRGIPTFSAEVGDPIGSVSVSEAPTGAVRGVVPADAFGEPVISPLAATLAHATLRRRRLRRQF
jgi:hypothetical protein